MEDPPFDDVPPPADEVAEPEANADPSDPLRPDIDEEHDTVEAPLADPQDDMDANNDEGASTHHNEDDAGSDSDALSEVDEAQFEDFDPNAIAITEKPGIIDADSTALIGKHKRKRREGDDETRKLKRKKKRSERRERPDDEARSAAPVEIEENLTPEERAAREFDAKLEAALAKPKKASRRKAGIDLEAQADEEIAQMKDRMAKACEADSKLRLDGKPAVMKLKMLPGVMSLLNRNTLQNAVVDPDMNLLKSVRFFLEPLDDGSMPAYNIQYELMTCLAKLPITRDALVSSEVGKVVYFYTRTKRAQPNIKRMAEKLVGEWTRLMIGRNDDYRQRELREANYDPNTAAASQAQRAARQAKVARQRLPANRNSMGSQRLPETADSMRVQRSYNTSIVGTYTVVPRSDLAQQAAQAHSQGSGGQYRRIGTGGEEMFKKYKAQSGKGKSGR